MPKVGNKALPPRKPIAAGCFVFAGGFTIGVRKHFETTLHLEGNNYGVEVARRNLRGLEVVVGAENWPVDRVKGIDFLYGNPPCFTAETLVLTEDGWERIGDLVKSKSMKRVASVTEGYGGKITWNKITEWHENSYRGDILSIKLVHGQVSARGRARTYATKNHKFMTKRGWVEAGNLQLGDWVATGEPAPNPRQRAVVDGMLLGDGSISRQPQCKTGQTCHELVKLKANVLSTLGSKTYVSVLTNKIHSDGSPRKDKLELFVKTGIWVRQERKRWYPAGKKEIPDDLQLTPMTLAVWYMDDGRGRNLITVGGPEYASRRVGPVAELATHGFSDEDLDKLIVKLYAIGIRAMKRVRKSGYVDLVIRGKSALTFFGMVGKYVCPEMRYKLPFGCAEFDPVEWEPGSAVTGWDNVETSYVRENKWGKVYCLGVEGIHNFVTKNGVAHNCACWSGNNPNAGKDGGNGWKTDPRLSCTKSFFELMLKARPKVWAWKSVCLAPVRGKAFVDELTREAMAAGYSVSQVFHDAQYLGVPQVRKRWFLVCHRIEYTPAPVNFNKVITAGECLAAIEPTRDQARDSKAHMVFDKWIPKIPQGMRLRTFWERAICPPEKQVKNDKGQVKGRCGLTHVRLREDSPAVGTVGYAMVHPTKHRFMHINEVAAIAGFPPSFDFGHTGHGGKELDLIARGVCPPVGKWLAKGVAASIKRDVPVKSPKVVVYDFRVPGVTPVDVTADYKETA